MVYNFMNMNLLSIMYELFVCIYFRGRCVCVCVCVYVEGIV